MIVSVVAETKPLEETYASADRYGLKAVDVASLRVKLFAYVLGILVGDADKRGGMQRRVSSMNVDLQLIKSEPSNEALGECVCLRPFGVPMHRVRDKPPSGEQLLGEHPSFAYRWISGRSPLIGWMFRDCLGLGWDETTSTDPVRWIGFSQVPRNSRRDSFEVSPTPMEPLDDIQ